MQLLSRHPGGSKRTDYVYFPVSGGIAKLAFSALSYYQPKDRLNNLGVKMGLYKKFANRVLKELAHRKNITLSE